MNPNKDKLYQQLQSLLELHPNVGWIAIIDSTGNLLTSINLTQDHQDDLWQRIHNVASEMQNTAFELEQDSMTYIRISGKEQHQILIFPILCLAGLLIIRLHQPVNTALLHLDVSRTLDKICDIQKRSLRRT